MNSQDQTQAQRQANAGIFLAGATVLFFIGVAWHSMVHPQVGATADYSMRLIASNVAAWVTLHMFLAIAVLLFAAATLAIFVTCARLTGSFVGLTGWAILPPLAVFLSTLAAIEGTAQADAAIAGELNAFAPWFSLSRGFEITIILLPIASLAITVQEFRASHPLTPKWASGVAILGSILVIVAVVAASGLRIATLGPLWNAAVAPLFWFVLLGVRLAFAGNAN